MKKMTFKKLISCVLSVFMLFACVACRNNANEQRVLTEEEIVKLADKIPDYSEYTHRFEYFAYSSLADGTFTEGEMTYFGGEDFRNRERIFEYAESGLTILMPERSVCVDENVGLNFNFEKSQLKEMMDWAEEAQLKVIVTDYRLFKLLRGDSESIIGEGKDFATEEELDALVKAYMEAYAAHPAFYGVQLPDERPHYVFKSFGEIYKSIKRCYPNAYAQINLIPNLPSVTRGEDGHLPQPTEEQIQDFQNQGYSAALAEQAAAFHLYLNKFIDETGADYISYDSYPLRDGRFDESYVCGLQVAANVSKERGVKFHFVSQTFSFKNLPRILSTEDLRCLNNMSLGFGVKQLAYFTYFNRSDSALESFADGASFITRLGKKTRIYYDMQKILAENQKFAPVIMNFDYVTSGWYIAENPRYRALHITPCVNGTFTKIASFESDKEAMLMTELYDKGNDRYMYMIQNAIDPASIKSSATYQTTTIKFNTNYNYAVVWKNGERSVVQLADDSYCVSQHPGEAVYVIPFKV